MVPSRRIMTPFIDYPNIFDVSLASRLDSKDKFEYTIKPNYDTQEVYFHLRYKDYLKGDRLRIDVLENNSVNTQLEPLYDERRNLLIQNNRGYVSYLGDELKNVCYVGHQTKQTMKGLAWALLALYALTFFFLLLWSCMCWKKYNYGQLFGYWKFFLHMWSKLQMVAFFLVLAITQPCCVKAFLK